MTAEFEKVDQPNPLLKANRISKFFFWWLRDLLRNGVKNEITSKNLYETMPEDLSASLLNDLETAWAEEQNVAKRKSRKASLWRAIIKTYIWDFMKFSIFHVGFSIVLTLQPQLLEAMMLYFTTNSTITPRKAYVNATIFVLLMFLQSALLSHGMFRMIRMGMHARIACSSLIYKKLTKLSCSSANRSKGSSLINILSNDVTKFDGLFTNLPFLAVVPFQLVATTYLIWKYVGTIPTIVGITVMIMQTTPLQTLYYKLTLRLRAKQVARSDKRISLIGEIISGIRAIKMYVWENHFEKLVYLTRSLEIKGYVKISYVTATAFAVFILSSRLCAFLIAIVYATQYGYTISAEKIVPISLHLANLRLTMGVYFFFGLGSVTDMRVSMKRIQNFLLLDEIQPSVGEANGSSHDGAVSIKNVTASWDKKLVDKTLTNITIEVRPKKLYGVVGSVGSGKSSILKLILGELSSISGLVHVNGKISYASQEPWLFTGSVRDNILFGQTYNEERYNEVVEACALLEDFEQLPYGDKTLVGERGLSLSGGQCARVSLARAVYREADIYLLDDPLSAVDSRVSKKLIDDCINGLLKDKTRVVVIDKHLNKADEIILLNSGKVEFQGSPKNIQDVNHYSRLLQKGSTIIDELDCNDEATKNIMKTKVVAESLRANDCLGEPTETEELLVKGSMKKSVYWRYIRAGGVLLLTIVVVLNILSIASISGFDYGLASWTKNRNEYFENQTYISFDGNSPKTNGLSIEKSLFILGGFLLLMLITSITKTFFLYKFALKASKNIHNDMFANLMKTPLRFFEVNPSGRIMNRFSEDTGNVDNTLPFVLLEMTQTGFHAIGLAVPLLLIRWWNTVPIAITLCLCTVFSKAYVTIIQKLKRLVGITKSPVLSLAMSSLDGLTTIRSCRAEDIVGKEFHCRQDRHTSAHFLALSFTQGFVLWMDFIINTLFAFFAYASVALKTKDTFSGSVGLSLMQLLIILTLMSCIVRQMAEAFAQMTSVERMLQFTELDRETSIDNEPIGSWPTRGQIKFEQLYLRYSDDSEPALKNLNFTIESRCKVGIVGRTGAGKSSLISALFRLAAVDGSITIDGLDTAKIRLSTLRSRISIIPQQPLLFNGTLRDNLDPRHEFDDASLWSALEDVELNKTFASLDHSIDRGGSNMSLGQRQLLCLARAILKNNRILVLDEATANVDLATDALIQKTIRLKFRDCTVLTIAHRLNTIMDSDKILVMDDGRVVEYDRPHLLLQKNDGFFSKMVHLTGVDTSQSLKIIARQAFESYNAFPDDEE